MRDLLARFGCWVFGHDWLSPQDWVDDNTEWDGGGYGAPVRPTMRPLVSRCLLCGKSEARTNAERAAVSQMEARLRRLKELSE